MKGKLLLIATVAVLAMSSCMRDEDWKLLKNPIHLQGHVDPSYGVPVAYGQMTLHDILGMLDESYTGRIDANSDVITIYFDTNAVDTIKNIIPAQTTGSKGMKTDPEFFTMVDTIMEYSVPITLFDKVAENELVGNENIQIDELWLNLHMILKALVPDNVEAFVNNDDNVRSHLDQFEIWYTPHSGGSEIKFTESLLPDETLKHLIDGDTVESVVNMASVINKMPKSIRIRFHYDFKVSLATLFGGMSTTQMMELRDSINKLRIAYDATLHADFPLDVKINELPYNFKLKLNGDSLARFDIQETLDSIANGLSGDLSEAKLSLAFDNQLPVDLCITTYLIDENDAIIGDTLIHKTRLAAAPLGTDPNGDIISVGSTRTNLVAQIDEQRLRDLKKTRKIGFNLSLATAGTGTAAIRRDDYLYVKAYVMVHATANADIPLTNQGLIK